MHVVYVMNGEATLMVETWHRENRNKLVESLLIP